MLLDLPVVADTVLAAVQIVAGREGVDLPARRYVTAGASGGEAWDCDQVVVGLVAVAPAVASLGGAEPSGLAGGGHGGIVGLPALQLRVEIVRRVPTIGDDGALPDVGVEHAAGLRGLTDAALLHAVRAYLVDTAAATDGDPVDVRTGPVVPTGPEGGMAGVAMTVAITIIR